MSRRVRSFALSTSLVVLASAWGLTACGGGGGGGSEAAPTPSSLNVTLSASSNSIANKQAVTLNAVANAPAAAGSASGVSPSNVVTVAQSSWDYGDGQSGTTASHTYAKAGTYTVTYSFTDSLGLKGQGTTQVTVKACSDAGLAAAAASTLTTVCVQTTGGEMVFELDTAHAPITTANFLGYVDAGFYNGTIFHRVIKGFMAQGGGYTTALTHKTVNAPIKLESQNGLLNNAYTLAMARTSAPNSATSEFFINFVNNAHLNYRPASTAADGTITPQEDGYAVFGKVIGGTAVVDALQNVPVQVYGPFEALPSTPAVILGMTRIH